jgi:YfiH family protein
MPFQQNEDLKYFCFELLEDAGVVQGIFTRHGGVSLHPWHSLNVGGGSGDTREHIIENRWRMFQSVGRKVESLFDVWQVHSSRVICSDTPRPLNQPHEKADAILTDNERVTLFMRFGDCVPIFIHDPIRRVVGIIHAGWQGTIDKIAAAAVQSMKMQYHCAPQDLLVGIGPSIGPDHYEVGDDVILKARQAFGNDASEILLKENGRTSMDLWKANSLILREAGVKHIQVSGVCTACHVDDWFSHRAENGNTGRFGAILALNTVS